jgi:hypothetical protein
LEAQKKIKAGIKIKLQIERKKVLFGTNCAGEDGHAGEDEVRTVKNKCFINPKNVF